MVRRHKTGCLKGYHGTVSRMLALSILLNLNQGIFISFTSLLESRTDSKRYVFIQATIPTLRCDGTIEYSRQFSNRNGA